MTTIDNTPPATGPIWQDGKLIRLLVVAFAAFTSFGLTLASLPQWAATGGAGVGLVGLVTAAMLTATVVVQLCVPLLTARFRGDVLLGLGLVLLGLPSPLYFVSNDVLWLMAVSAVRGAGFGILTVLGASLAVSIAPPARRGEVVGVYGIAIAIPTTVAVPIGLAWALDGSFALVAFGAMAPALAVFLVSGLVPDLRHSADVPVSSARLLAHGRDAMGALSPSVVVFAVTFAGAGYLTFIPLAANVGPQVVLAVWIFSIAGALARWGAGFVADRWGSRHLLIAAAIASGVGLLAVAVDIGHGSLGALGLGGAAVFGIGYGAVQNLTLLEAVARTQNHEVASSVWNIGFDAGTATGAWLIGLVAASSFGVSGGMGVASIAIFASVFLLWWGRPSHPHHRVDL